MNRGIQCVLWLTILLFWVISAVAEPFLKVSPGKVFDFPRDHGAHSDYPTEWWYFTGHLKSKERVTYGFELTFFRVGVQREQRPSAWHVSNVYLAHFALTDDRGGRFFFSKRKSRPNFDRAGASEQLLSVWLDDWSAKMEGGNILLRADSRDELRDTPFSLELVLTPGKPVVLHGDAGFSQKGAGEGEASYYMSFTRLIGDGGISIGGIRTEVQASAWMDHEVLSFSANSEKLGWDWFAVQLDDGREIMFFSLRDEKGNISPYSSGTFVNQDGSYHHLSRDDFSIEEIGSWTSPRTNITYPSGWKVILSKKSIALLISPTVENQELASDDQSTRAYWEGRCMVRGEDGAEQALSGSAYVELVGYR